MITVYVVRFTHHLSRHPWLSGCSQASSRLMANEFYDPGAQRAEKVRLLFGTIARRYDLINDLQSFGLHRYWKWRLARLARAHPGDRVLDVCCGTGDLVFAFARRGAEVVGVDFSAEMLAIAEERARRFRTRHRGEKSNALEQQAPSEFPSTSPSPPQQERAGERRPQMVTLVQGDAQKLTFSDNSFDVVTVAYGLRNLASWRAGLCEMRRVARPGGRLVVLDFGKPDNLVWRRIYFAYLRGFIPLLGKIVCGNSEAYAYILESLKHYPAQHGVAEEMRRLGFGDVRVVSLLGGVMSINVGVKGSSS